MPFVKKKGVKGLVYVPDEVPAFSKKHACPDCVSCQWCSDARCSLCLSGKKRCSGVCGKKKKSGKKR